MNTQTKRFLTLFIVVSLVGLLAASPTMTQGQSDSLLGCQRNNPDRLDCSSLEVIGVCEGDVAVFTIRNTGEPGEGDMRAPTEYRLVVDGVVVEIGTVQLAGGESIEIRYSGGGRVTLEVDQQIGHPGNSRPRLTLVCTGETSTPVPPTDEPTPTHTPTPTEEVPTDTPTFTPTPTEEVPTDTPTSTPTFTPTATPGDPNILVDDAYCSPFIAQIFFFITNYGANMTQEATYWVEDAAGNVIESGTFLLEADETLVLIYDGYLELTLFIDGWAVEGVNVVCEHEITPTDTPTPTPTPTEEVPTDTPTFTPTPTEEVPTDTPTPTPTPTEEPPTDTPTFTPTPTEEPPTATFTHTPTPTSSGPRGCQRNNRERLDCSSLEVTGVCEGGVAVFTIHNSGEPGEGDMVTPTMYRLIVNGTVIEIGSVQLAGGESMEIRYDGGGRVTLEADQQIGHPGRSQPRETLTCSR